MNIFSTLMFVLGRDWLLIIVAVYTDLTDFLFMFLDGNTLAIDYSRSAWWMMFTHSPISLYRDMCDRNAMELM